MMWRIETRECETINMCTRGNCWNPTNRLKYCISRVRQRVVHVARYIYLTFDVRPLTHDPFITPMPDRMCIRLKSTVRILTINKKIRHSRITVNQAPYYCTNKSQRSTNKKTVHTKRSILIPLINFLPNATKNRQMYFFSYIVVVVAVAAAFHSIERCFLEHVAVVFWSFGSR